MRVFKIIRGLMQASACTHKCKECLNIIGGIYVSKQLLAITGHYGYGGIYLQRSKTELKIIESAFEMFAASGYKETSTRKIAMNAGVNEVTIFRLFKTKNNLFREMLNYYANVDYIKGNLKMESSGDFRADLEVLCRGMLKRVSKRNKLIKILLSQGPNDALIRKKVREVPRSIASFIGEYLRVIAPEEHREKIDYDMVALILVSYIFRYSMASSVLARDPFNAHTEKNIDRFLNILINGILNEN
jgi:AcrR family transcriptional regulator